MNPTCSTCGKTFTYYGWDEVNNVDKWYCENDGESLLVYN